jgi:alpha-amylase
MRKRINLLLGVHNHQPVDNWDHVIEDAYKKCYRPFLDVLEAHPGVKMGVHYTGYLLDWLVEHHPELIEQLQRMIQSGQVEMFTGGYYEPILPTIPDAHKVGQIRKLSQRIQELTGQTPKGLWLAERVWEPHLVKYLAEAGVEYLCVDDAHFKSVGMKDADLLGRYTSEEMGKMADIFPVSKDLRYLIPYAEPDEIVSYLAALATEKGERAGIYFDDGEKFGVWPGTYKTVYKEKWLDRFFTALEKNQDVIQSVTPSQYVESVPSFGRVYLPTASYSEMLEWALPAQDMNALESALKEAPEAHQPFIRGGYWRHFLVKYPESNNLHKKMLYVCEKLEALEKKQGFPHVAAQEHVWMGQSNDVFWHGVFGGLYLTNLRTANYQHLLKAEALIDEVAEGEQFFRIQTRDFDCDGQPEVLVESHLQNLYLDPSEGGALFELDYRPKAFNLLDTLARRYEAYHDKLAGAVYEEEGSAEQAQSIHDRVVTKEKGLEKLLHYDASRRMSLMDHFFEPDVTLEQLHQNTYEALGDFIDQPYAVDVARDQVALERIGTVDGRSLRVRKTLSFEKEAAKTTIVYELTNLSETSLACGFAPEFNVNLLAPDAPDRYYYLPQGEPASGRASGGGTAVAQPVSLKDARMVSKGVLAQTSAIGLKDEWMGIDYALHFSQPADVFRFPVETVSQSEAGFEKIYQSSALYPRWQLELSPGQTWQVTIEQVIQSL